MKRSAYWRKQVLNVLSDASTPCTAYDVLGGLRDEHPQIAPTTVYRALSGLIENGQVHRLESTNAYIVCQCQHEAHSPILTICDDCGTVEERAVPQMLNALADLVSQSGFAALRQVIELHGQCSICSGAV